MDLAARIQTLYGRELPLTIANIVRLANSPEAPRCRSWNPDDPEGCWTHDAPSAAGIDYCGGFRIFVEFYDALEYGVELGGTFTLGFDPKSQRWEVTPLNGTYGS